MSLRDIKGTGLPRISCLDAGAGVAPNLRRATERGERPTGRTGMASILGEETSGAAERVRPTGEVALATRLHRALARGVDHPRRVPLQVKLVIAFLLVSLVPMLVAAQ